jgi:hypothetical protein
MTLFSDFIFTFYRTHRRDVYHCINKRKSEGTHGAVVNPPTGRGARLGSIPDAALFVEDVSTFLFGRSLLNTMFSGMSLPLNQVF